MGQPIKPLLEETAAGPKRKGGQPLTEQEWEKIVVLVLRGHTFAAVARMTGFHERTIRRFHKEGFQREPWGRTPIRMLVEQEQAKARAQRLAFGADRPDPSPAEADEAATLDGQLAAATVAQRGAARTDALNARTAEAQLVKLSRGNVLALVGASVSLMKPAKAVADAIGTSITKMVDAGGMKASEGFALLRQISGLLREVVGTGAQAMEMERLLLGDPSGAGGLAKDAASMTEDDALVELGNAAKVFRSLERRGLRLVADHGADVVAPEVHVQESTAGAAEPMTGDGPQDAGPEPGRGEAMNTGNSHYAEPEK